MSGAAGSAEGATETTGAPETAKTAGAATPGRTAVPALAARGHGRRGR